jgi:hypothetical protein
MARITWTEGSEGESEEVSGVEDLITEDLELLPIDGLREEISQHFVGGCVNNIPFSRHPKQAAVVRIIFRIKWLLNSIRRNGSSVRNKKISAGFNSIC